MIPADRSHLSIAASTHPGMSGKNNEDRHAVFAYQIGVDQPIPAVIAIVSDGIGGHRAGEVAAEIAVEQINQSIKNSDGSTPIQTLREAIKEASQSIRAQSESDPEKSGMGATCACAWIIGNRLYIAYAGDSRIYLIRKKTILQLSKDHTWVQDALDAGIIKTGQAEKHPNAHVIRRYLGSAQPVEPDTRLYLSPSDTNEKAESNQGFVLSSGDQIVLCSDGLTDLVRQDEMLAAFTSLDQKQVIEKLIDLANQRGGHDNITIVALKVPSDVPAEATAKTIPISLRSPRQTRRRLRITQVFKACLITPILLGVLILILLGGYVYQKYIIPINASPTTTYIGMPTQATTVPTLSTFPLTTSPSAYPPSITAPAGNPITPTVQVTLTAWPTNTTIP